MSPRTLRWIKNVWPPFLFSGVRVEYISADWRQVRVRMRLHWFTRNYVGTHFSGSLFSMTDPFWMIMVLRALGEDYIVWDKAGELSFVSPGRATVLAEFHLSCGAGRVATACRGRTQRAALVRNRRSLRQR